VIDLTTPLNSSEVPEEALIPNTVSLTANPEVSPTTRVISPEETARAAFVEVTVVLKSKRE